MAKPSKAALSKAGSTLASKGSGKPAKSKGRLDSREGLSTEVGSAHTEPTIESHPKLLCSDSDEAHAATPRPVPTSPGKLLCFN